MDLPAASWPFCMLQLAVVSWSLSHSSCFTWPPWTSGYAVDICWCCSHHGLSLGLSWLIIGDDMGSTINNLLVIATATVAIRGSNGKSLLDHLDLAPGGRWARGNIRALIWTVPGPILRGQTIVATHNDTQWHLLPVRSFRMFQVKSFVIISLSLNGGTETSTPSWSSLNKRSELPREIKHSDWNQITAWKHSKRKLLPDISTTSAISRAPRFPLSTFPKTLDVRLDSSTNDCKDCPRYMFQNDLHHWACQLQWLWLCALQWCLVQAQLPCTTSSTRPQLFHALFTVTGIGDRVGYMVNLQRKGLLSLSLMVFKGIYGFLDRPSWWRLLVKIWPDSTD